MHPCRWPEPAYPPSRSAPLVWALGAAIPWLGVVFGAADLVRRWTRGCPGCMPPRGHLTAAGALVSVVVAPIWRYRVHRWQIGPQAVYTRTGWLVQERRIAPISRVQTVDTYRGPLDRLFGLGQRDRDDGVLGRGGADRGPRCAGGRSGGGPADRHRRARRPRRNMTVAGAQWQRLSPRMLLVHPVHEVLNQLPLLIGAIVLGSATAESGGGRWSASASSWCWDWPGGSPPATGSTNRTSCCVPGLLQRSELSVPRNRIRSVQTEARAAAPAAGADACCA